MRMQDFKDGKISVWAETKEDTKRFIDTMKAEGIPWIMGQKYEQSDYSFRKCEYGYGVKGKAMGRVSGIDARGWYSSQNILGKPYTSITVAEFFAEPKRHNT